MKQLTSFTIGFLTAISAVIILNLPESVPVQPPDYGYNEPTYTTEKRIGGWCAGRIIKRNLTYEAKNCAREFGQIPINITHTDSPEWESMFVRKIQEVDSLTGMGRCRRIYNAHPDCY